jgi:large subunit ribosomal protein L21
MADLFVNISCIFISLGYTFLAFNYLKMFAVIQTGGKQFIVREGEKVKVEKLDAEEGAKHIFERVLAVSKDDKSLEVGAPFLDKKVEAKVLDQGHHKKLRVFKMKAKKRYRRTQGHKQAYTEVEIVKIG